MISRLFFLTLISLSILSCNHKELDLPNFDESAWQKDKDGCDGIRAGMRDNLIKVKDGLKGLNGDEVTSILGKPNKTDLVSRNQKYFIYDLSCRKELAETATLSIRFNATGLAYEVVVY